MQRILLALAVLALAALIAASHLRNGIYATEVSLYGDTAGRSPGKARALNNLGDALKKAGRNAEALPYFERALTVQPDYPDALNNLATVYNSMGRRQEGLNLLLDALRLHPEHLQARYNLALSYYESGHAAEAEEQYLRIVELAPESREAAFARMMLRMLRTNKRP